MLRDNPGFHSRHFEITDCRCTVRLAQNNGRRTPLWLAIHRAILWSPVVWGAGDALRHNALVAVVVVAFTWIVLEAKARFRRRSPAISQAMTRLPDGGGAKK
jgi:hypothetical protein